ncbi:sulfotransferase domain-containing protein [Desulfocastanea catecholica]
MNLKNENDSILWFKFNGLLRYALAHTATKLFPLYILNEYPKSGASWIGEMLSDALEIPFPRNRLPVFSSSILHGHMMHNWNMHNVIIVWRDGRDVLISQYFHFLFENEKGNRKLVEKCRTDLQFNNYEDIKTNLPRFMEYVYVQKKYPRFSWIDFSKKWANCDNCTHVKYEDMRVRPVDELTRIVHSLSGIILDKKHVEDIIYNHSFEKISGRKVGEENTHSFLRKGIVGDWKNYFSLVAKELFLDYAGDVLIQLGYEKDSQWVQDEN